MTRFTQGHTDRNAEYVLPELLRDAAHDPEVLCIRLTVRLSSAAPPWTVRVTLVGIEMLCG